MENLEGAERIQASISVKVYGDAVVIVRKYNGGNYVAIIPIHKLTGGR